MTTYNKPEVNGQLTTTYRESENALDLADMFGKKIAEYDLSKTRVAMLLGIDKDILEDFLRGETRQPTLVNIIKIADFLEIDLEEAIKAILRTQSPETLRSIEKARNATFIAKHFDIKKLSKLGFFEASENGDLLAGRVLHYFDFDSVHEYETQLILPLSGASKRQNHDKMNDFWVKSAYRCFKAIENPHAYDREGLKSLIPRIKPYCQDERNGLLTVCRALYNSGVTVIFQNQFLTTPISGGTFVVNGKPCIVLTDLNKRYAAIWWALAHELYHVLHDLEKISESGYHLSGEPDLALFEEKANEFALEYFCGQDYYRYIAPNIEIPFLVKKLSRKLDVHPCFVYSAYLHFEEQLNGRNYWKAFEEYLPQYAPAVRPLAPITPKEDSLSGIAKNIRQILESAEA